MLVSSQMEDLSPVASLLLLAMLCDYVMGQSKELNFFFSPPPLLGRVWFLARSEHISAQKGCCRNLQLGAENKIPPPLDGRPPTVRSETICQALPQSFCE